MPKAPRLTAPEAERLLLRAGFRLIRSRGSHRVYQREERRCVLPFHAEKTLQPKLVKQVLAALDEE